MPGLAIESLILLPAALAWLLYTHAQGEAAFLDGDVRSDVLLVLGGALTALPLLGFAYGARRIPYSLVGFLQYISPTLQLLCGVLLLGEPFGSERAIGFTCIWIALALYAADGWRRSRAPRPTEPQPHCETHVPASDGATPAPEEEGATHAGR
jgi:chloramphenicol-sensitive protein RarD